MSKNSSAYQLAESIQSKLFDDALNQSRGPISEGEVRADIADPYKTKRLTIYGKVDGKPVYQKFAKSQRNGHFYLSTVFTEPGGAVETVRITETAPDSMVRTLEATLFMAAIQGIVEDRSQL